jgi:hypothetical protein
MSVTSQAYVPLSFAPGEAYQFDWSHEIVVINNVTTTVKVAHVRLCHSRMMFVRVPPHSTGPEHLPQIPGRWVWEAIWTESRTALRERLGRDASPTAVVFDSQSLKSGKGAAKTTQWGTIRPKK